ASLFCFPLQSDYATKHLARPVHSRGDPCGRPTGVVACPLVFTLGRGFPTLYSSSREEKLAVFSGDYFTGTPRPCFATGREIFACISFRSIYWHLVITVVVLTDQGIAICMAIPIAGDDFKIG